MALSPAEQHLSRLRKYGIRPSLERIRAALALFGSPQRRFPVVLITGTNGKGTCARALSEILRAHDVRAGLYTSPHMHSYVERFSFAGRNIRPGTLSGLVMEQRRDLDAMKLRLTEFEFLTLLAYRWFARKHAEWAVVETGMGGRWDATAAADPVLSVITSVGLDHTEFLGRTTAHIAADKAHVARTGCDLLVGPVGAGERKAIKRVAKDRGARTCFLPHHSVRCGVDSFRHRGIWSCRQPPTLFAFDLALALESAHKILGRRFDRTRAQRGILCSVLPGRFEQRMFRRRRMILDVAHNGAALSALFSEIRRRFAHERMSVVLGMQRHKHGEMEIIPYLQAGDEIRLVRWTSAPCKSAADWSPFVRKAAARGVRVHAPGRMRTAMNGATAGPDSIIVVTGSFHTVREADIVCR